jgi:hypothetical protein
MRFGIISPALATGGQHPGNGYVRSIVRGRQRTGAGAVLAALLSAACAALSPHPSAAAPEVVLYAGEFDVEEAVGEGPYEAGVVVRLAGTPIWRFNRFNMVLVPAFGAMKTQKNAFYGWVGGSLMIPLSARWGLIPETGVGYYRRGEAKDLGGSLEFRSGLEVVHRVDDRLRVGVELYHLSNAGIHRLNPGANSLVFTIGIGGAPLFRAPPPRASSATRSSR